MRLALTILCLMSGLAITSCQTISQPPGQTISQPLGQQPAIEITLSESCSLPPPFTFSSGEMYIFEPTGECRFSSERFGKINSPGKTEKAWQSKAAYGECAKMLNQINFFSIRDEVPRGNVGGSARYISVKWGLRTHSVRFDSDQDIARFIALLQVLKSPLLPPPKLD